MQNFKKSLRPVDLQRQALPPRGNARPGHILNFDFSLAQAYQQRILGLL